MAAAREMVDVEEVETAARIIKEREMVEEKGRRVEFNIVCLIDFGNMLFLRKRNKEGSKEQGFRSGEII